MRDDDTHSHHMYPAPRVVHGFADPDIDIKQQGSRVGNAQRARAVAHVQAMIQAGYLTGSEGGARCNLIEKAATSDEVNRLISDLPALTRPRRFDWDSPRYYIPVLLSTLAASAITGFLPSLVINALGATSTAWGVAVMTITIVAGVIGVMGSIVAMVAKSE